MLSSVEQAFVGREEIRAPLKMPAWEATSVETLDHLFFSCPLAQAVLSWLQSLLSRCSALIPPFDVSACAVWF